VHRNAGVPRAGKSDKVGHWRSRRWDRTGKPRPEPLLDGEPATAEPKKLPYRLLHAGARITCGARRLHLRIAETPPWRHDLTTAFARLAALPLPAT
jgi:hypothetical protein